MIEPYIIAVGLCAFAAGLCAGLATALYATAQPAPRRGYPPRTAEQQAAYERYLAQKDEAEVDAQATTHVEGLRGSTMFNAPRASFPPKPYSEFDGPGQHATGPLFLERPGV